MDGLVIPLDAGWELCLTTPGALTTAEGLDALVDWHTAQVPGTVSGALGQAVSYEAFDVWYRTRPNRQGGFTLRLLGLATLADVWLDGTLILHSDNMFQSHEMDVVLTERSTLAICFRSLQAHLQKPGKRARWRPRMIKPSTLNAVRTTVLGHADGWCPPVPPVGPWRGIELVGERRVADIDLRARFDGGSGRLDVALSLSGVDDTVWLCCDGRRVAMSEEGTRFSARLDLSEIEAWWPHTHGRPVLHDVCLSIGETHIDLGRVGFRDLRIDRGPDGEGFTLVCNEVPIFCRGACWTPTDLLNLPSTREATAPRLALAAKAGMNMLRVGGTMVYEATAFYDLCDELGILVWQDFMFANFDYPAADPAFVASVETEATQFLRRVQASPCIAVLCGGSEVYQQAAMMGLPRDIWRNPIFEEILPRLCAEIRPDVAYVVNSPSGGMLPFAVGQGIAHYYGVGAYMRPLADARRAGVRFTTECLAFANVAEHPTDWQTAPRDAGADWDFADVRDHYLRLLFGCDPADRRLLDEPRYLEAARATTAHVMRETMSEFRRPASPTAGALVWFLSDLQPGSGWGVIDSDGAPKSAWHGLRDCLHPVQILTTDEGLDGLDVHAINETAEALTGEVRITCLRDGHVRVADGTVAVALPARCAITLHATDIFGAFFDTTYAYRFGPPSHDAVVADLLVGERVISTSVFFPQAFDLETQPLGLAVALEHDADGWSLVISTQMLARFVQIEAAFYRAERSWFHLPPGREIRIALVGPAAGRPTGTVRAMNGDTALAFG